MSLDETLFIENETPWMVFCHEWRQITNGTLELVELTDDLSDTKGRPETLFRSTDVPWVHRLKASGGDYDGNITDGPDFFRTKTDRLIMIWSRFSKQGYALGQAYSASGRVKKPWKQIASPLFKEDGDHGMIFETFDGELLLALHQPNVYLKERAHFFQLKEREILG